MSRVLCPPLELRYSDETKAPSLLKFNDVFGLLVGAFCHDIGHPGTNNTFQVNALTDFALMYNDLSVLENYHAAQTFRIIASSEKSDIFANVKPAQKTNIRKTIIKCILATDMENHFALVTNLKTRVACTLQDA